jgi:hypothetical protein
MQETSVKQVANISILLLLFLLQVDQNNLEVLEVEEDVHVLTGALKLFFRELKKPLIPFEHFSKALKASSKYFFILHIEDHCFHCFILSLDLFFCVCQGGRAFSCFATTSRFSLCSTYSPSHLMVTWVLYLYRKNHPSPSLRSKKQ